MCKDNGIRAEYHGESGKSLHDRALGHMDKLKGMDTSSFMLRHNLLYHRDEDPLDRSYVWYPVKYHRKAIDRLVSEAINIKNAMDTEGLVLMNAKTEYTRCVLPGITPQATEQEKKEDNKVRADIMVLRELRDKAREREKAT